MRKFVLIFLLFIFPLISHAQSVDLLWQGSGYVPPFYKGLNLWGEQSLIKFQAIPQGLGSPAGLNYRWTRNGTVQGRLSGVGKSSFNYLSDVLARTQEVKVEIISNSGEVLASNSVTVTPRKAEVLVYEDNPLYGILFNKEVGGLFTLDEAEVSFAAIPYFFSGTSRKDPKFVYSWNTNSGGQSGGSSVTFRAPDSNSGQSLISINITRSDRLIQNASKSFLVQFGQ